MSLDFVELNRKRFEYLHAVYDRTGGDEQRFLTLLQLGSELGFDADEARKIVQYLEGEFLVRARWFIGGDGLVSITHSGRVEVERALQNKGQPTAHFPSLSTMNLTVIHHAGNVALQQGTTGSTQRATLRTVGPQSVEQFVSEIQHRQSELGLEADDAGELQSHLDRLAYEAQSPSAQGSRVGSRLGLVVELLKAATNTTLAQDLIAKAQALIGSTPSA